MSEEKRARKTLNSGLYQLLEGVGQHFITVRKKKVEDGLCDWMTGYGECLRALQDVMRGMDVRCGIMRTDLIARIEIACLSLHPIIDRSEYRHTGRYLREL